MSGRAARHRVVLALILTSGSTARAGPTRGERVFQRCYACHSVVAGQDKLEYAVHALDEAAGPRRSSPVLE